MTLSRTFWNKRGSVHLQNYSRALPWWRSGWDSALPMQGARVRSLARELDPTCTLQLGVRN